MSKHWNYEDDHDWDDDYDYAANGMVYWYGKYYPKETIDALFNKDNSVEEMGEIDYGRILIYILGMGTMGYGIYKSVKAIIKKRKREKEKYN